MTVAANAYAIAYRTILLNGYVYLAISINGRSLLPAGKAWIAEQAPAAQGPRTTGLAGVNPTAALASLAR